ncbi:MAG: glycoside hydrolase family protein [Hyphomonadaceae bacterium]|nr:glycoside hydrolase family protein [Hyphomonadaceae bacterium]
MARMSISRTGLELIESFEGFRARAARLPDGTYTIGFGHTQFARDGIVIDRLEAEDQLRWDLRPVEDVVRQNVHAPISQNQFDALVSLAFNIGTEHFLNSEVLAHFNAGEPIAAATAMGAWRCAVLNGTTTIVDALVRRRAAEAALFLEPDGNRPPAPTPVVVPTNDNQARRVRPTDRVVRTDGNGTILAAFPEPEDTVPPPARPAPTQAEATQPVPTRSVALPRKPEADFDDEAASPDADLARETGDAALPEAANDAATLAPEPSEPLVGTAAVRARLNQTLQAFPASDELNFETIDQTAPVQRPVAPANGFAPLPSLPANDQPFGRRKAPLEPIPPRVTTQSDTSVSGDAEDGAPPLARTVNQVLTGIGGMAMVLGLWRSATEGLLNRPADAPTLTAMESTPLLAAAIGFVLLVVGLIGLAGENKGD